MRPVQMTKRHEIPPPLTLDTVNVPPTLDGESPKMKALLRQVDRLAPAPLPALIHGETGSGKELCARALHDRAPWREGPFIAINCAAIPRELLTSELFGSTTGAFTGARNRPGLIGKAHQGTLFLDEIGELSLEAQSALLRVLDRQEVRAVGSEQPKRVNFRLVSATHRDLWRLVHQGQFREDLYHRISTFTLRVPSLRDRQEDLKRLCYELAPEVAERLTKATWTALKMYPWPGNVRELKNTLLRIRYISPDGSISPALLGLNSVHCNSLETADERSNSPRTTPPEPPPAHAASLLPEESVEEEVISQLSHQVDPKIDPKPLLSLSLRDRASLFVRDVVSQNEGNISQAAESLEIGRGTVYRYLTHAESCVTTAPPRVAEYPEGLGEYGEFMSARFRAELIAELKVMLFDELRAHRGESEDRVNVKGEATVGGEEAEATADNTAPTPMIRRAS
jgi:DNA-binding NtrC family response regulator